MQLETIIPVLRLPPGEYVTPPDLATAMQVSDSTVRRWIRDNRLPVRNDSAPGKKPVYKIPATSALEFYLSTFK